MTVHVKMWRAADVSVYIFCRKRGRRVSAWSTADDDLKCFLLLEFDELLLICLWGKIAQLAVRSFRQQVHVKLFATLWNRACQRVVFHDVHCWKFRCQHG